ncbi:MAG: acyltransferase family protein [Deltaproteobacteria bacterium]|nr:acyltransferase family protein [Deltaproteobacteria bacterium]
MGITTALAKRATRSESTLRGKLLGFVRGELDDLIQRVAGNDFDKRIAQIQARGQGADPFGFDPEWAKYALASAALFHKYYFRVETHGIDNVPEGRALLIANHSGQIPIDAGLILSAMFYDANPPRMLRSMVEKWSQTLPVVSTFFARCGQVVGVPENATRLLEMGEALLVFPEGTRGISKPFSERYRLQDFGLGFMRLALETRTPIVPIAVVGAEEQYINLGNVQSLARALKMPVFPIVPQWMIPGLQMPLPTRYRIYFGDPLEFKGDPDDEDAVMEEKVEVVRATIQAMINRGLKQRKGLFW